MTFKRFLLGFSLVAFAGAVQSQQQQPPQPRGQGQAQPQAQSQQQQRQQQQRGELRLSNLEGMEAVNAQGEDIGDLADVVIDLNRGRVHAVVLERGGVLGVGQQNFAFAPSAVKAGKQPDQVVINVDKQALETRQGFARNQWPGMQDEYWGRVDGNAAKTAQKGAGKMNLIRASELIGKPVQDKSGKPLGSVQDVVVGLDNGQLRNVVVDLQDGGRAQVPGKAIRMSGTDQRLVLDLNAQQLRSQARDTGAGAGKTR